MSHQEDEPALAAVARLFAEQGFHGTTLEQIAEALGLPTVSQLLAEFADKEALFYASVDAAALPEMGALYPRVQRAALNPKLRIFHKEALARLQPTAEDGAHPMAPAQKASSPRRLKRQSAP